MADDGRKAFPNELPAGAVDLRAIRRSLADPVRGRTAREPRRRRAVAWTIVAAVAIGSALSAGLVAARDDGLYDLIHADAAARLQRSPRPQPARQAGTAPSPIQAVSPVRAASDAPAPLRLASFAPPAAAPAALGARSVCVRLCDGYHFPIGTIGKTADLAAHEAVCQATCPSAPVRLFTLGAGQHEIGSALSSGAGRPVSYRSLPKAFAYQMRLDKACTCHGGPPHAQRVALLRDFTLRRGDAVVLPGGPKVFTGSGTWPYRASDFAGFRTAGLLGPAQRRQIDVLMGISRREAAERDFRRTMRVVTLESQPPQQPSSAGAQPAGGFAAVRPAPALVAQTRPQAAFRVLN